MKYKKILLQVVYLTPLNPLSVRPAVRSSVRSSVRPSVRPFVCPSGRPAKSLLGPKEAPRRGAELSSIYIEV